MIDEGAFRGWPACDVCRELVWNTDGVLSINQRAASARRNGIRRAYAEFRDEAGIIDMGQDAVPERIRWLWSHVRCAPAENDYQIVAGRCDTLGKAFGWTLHLMSKRWFDPVAWRAAVSRFYHVPHG
jgi:hypothetical protein